MWERSIDREQRAALGSCLKERRERIPAGAGILGPYPLPQRIGRRVTQEELAEAVGTSRAWYSMIECGAAPATSPRLLQRIATTLGLAPLERMTLVQLAFPEVVAPLAGAGF